MGGRGFTAERKVARPVGALALPLTERQTRLVHFIAGFMEHHDGIAPTFQECAIGMGMSGASRAGVQHLLERMEDRGWLRRLPRRSRAMELLRPVAVPRAPDGAPLYFVPVMLAPVHNQGDAIGCGSASSGKTAGISSGRVSCR